MPHAIYLHSALTQDVAVHGEPAKRRLAARSTLADVLVALSIAGFVNLAILLGARSLEGHAVESLSEAFTAFGRELGPATAVVFAVALLASGLASTSVGVYSGQIVVQGFVRRSIPVWARRTISFVPAFVVLAAGMEPTTALVLSQVTLSFGIPFALYPLLRFTADRGLMGDLVNRRAVTAAATAAAAVIIALNVYLLVSFVPLG
jgi:manganese transport protein